MKSGDERAGLNTAPSSSNFDMSDVYNGTSIEMGTTPGKDLSNPEKHSDTVEGTTEEMKRMPSEQFCDALNDSMGEENTTFSTNDFPVGLQIVLKYVFGRYNSMYPFLWSLPIIISSIYYISDKLIEYVSELSCPVGSGC